jgi:hypothetical protein
MALFEERCSLILGKGGRPKRKPVSPDPIPARQVHQVLASRDAGLRIRSALNFRNMIAKRFEPLRYVARVIGSLDFEFAQFAIYLGHFPLKLYLIHYALPSDASRKSSLALLVLSINNSA